MQDYVLSVAVSPDGNWVVSGSKDRSIQFWNASTGQAQFMLQGHKNSGKSAEVRDGLSADVTSNLDRSCSLWWTVGLWLGRSARAHLVVWSGAVDPGARGEAEYHPSVAMHLFNIYTTQVVAVVVILGLLAWSSFNQSTTLTFTKILRPVVNPVKDHGQIRGVVQQGFKLLDGVLL